MRRQHYERVVRWDRLQRFPYRENGKVVPKVTKVTLVWSLIGVGFRPAFVPAAWTALELITGQEPKRRTTKQSVAQRRLKEGDPVGCMVSVTGKKAYDRREQWLVRVFPEVRPFGGFEVRVTEAKEDMRKAKGVVDERGQFTFHMVQPGVVPARTPYYESFFPLVVGSSGQKVGGRYRSVETTAGTRGEGVALMEGRRFPIRGEMKDTMR
jgi:ribosomal protein L5